MEPLLIETVDELSLKEIPLRNISVCVEDQSSCKKVGPSLIVPTCSCDYVKWISYDMKVSLPECMNDFHPTKVKEDQCVYCGYYVKWSKIEYKNFESAGIPFWSNKIWYESLPDKTWFLDYLEVMERVKNNDYNIEY